MSAKPYVWAVQDRDGVEIVAWRGHVIHVSDVTAHHRPNGDLEISVEGSGPVAGVKWDGKTDDLTFYRWPGTDKLADPVAHKVVTG